MNHGEVMPGPKTQTAIRPMPEPTEVPHKYNPPTSQQLLSEYEIRIRFAHSGCVINVGCKEIAFTTVEEAMSAVQEYVNNREYWKTLFNMV